MKPSKTGFQIRDRAVEEAGHAVMSAHLKIPFSRIFINNRTEGIGGGVTHVFNSNKATEDYVRRHALVSLAGAAAQRTVWKSKIRENMTDVSSVYYVYGHLEESKRIPSLEDLIEQANSIFKDRGLRRAILLVAMILEIESRITAEEVRSIVREANKRKRRAAEEAAC